MDCCDNKILLVKIVKIFVLIVELFMIINTLMKYLLEIII